jgi:hypothetical protein
LVLTGRKEAGSLSRLGLRCFTGEGLAGCVWAEERLFSITAMLPP